MGLSQKSNYEKKIVSCFDIGEVPRSPGKRNWNWLYFLPFIFTFEQGGLVQKYDSNFGAEPFQWNFAKDPQKAKNVVKAKVAKTSNGALKRFLEPGMAVQKCYFYYGVVRWG